MSNKFLTALLGAFPSRHKHVLPRTFLVVPLPFLIGEKKRNAQGH